MTKTQDPTIGKDSFFLGHAADIFRCQARVDKVLRSQSGCLNPGVSPQLSVRELPGGFLLCPLARADDIDPETNFLRIGTLPDVQLRLPDRKYLLRKNDIVMSHSAKLDKLATVGLVQQDSIAIPGKNLLVLRSARIDPVWLFYYLRQERVREKILTPLRERIPEILGRRGIYKEYRGGSEKRIIGKDGSHVVSNAEYEKALSQQVFSLLMDDLRLLRIEAPSTGEIETVNSLHCHILDETGKIKKAQENSRLIGAKLDRIFSSGLAATQSMPDGYLPPQNPAGPKHASL